MKSFSTDRELSLVNEILWRHVCASTSPHRGHGMLRFNRLPPPPAMVESLMDGPYIRSIHNLVAKRIRLGKFRSKN